MSGSDSNNVFIVVIFHVVFSESAPTVAPKATSGCSKECIIVLLLLLLLGFFLFARPGLLDLCIQHCPSGGAAEWWLIDSCSFYDILTHEARAEREIKRSSVITTAGCSLVQSVLSTLTELVCSLPSEPRIHVPLVYWDFFFSFFAFSFGKHINLWQMPSGRHVQKIKSLPSNRISCSSCLSTGFIFFFFKAWAVFSSRGETSVTFPAAFKAALLPSPISWVHIVM